MDPRGLKRFESRQMRRFCRRSIRDKTQEHSVSAKGPGRGRRERTDAEEPSQIHSAVGLRRIDREVAARLVRNINVNGGNMRPLAIPFTSRHSYARLSPSDQNRTATPPRLIPPSPGPANLHPLIGARVRSANRNYARQLLAVT